MEELTLLGISASPRGDGNSLFLLQRAIEGAKSINFENLHLKVEVFSFRGKRFSSCEHCYGCERSKGECAIKDDFQELRDKWVDADIVIYSVPVYHSSIPGQLRCFHDRLGMSLSKRYPVIKQGNKVFYPPRYHLKVVGNIAQGLDIFAGQERALQELIIHAMLSNCIPISGDSYFGAGGWTARSRDKNSIEALAQAGDACAQTSVAEATSVGKRAVQLAAILRTGFHEMRTMLEQDQAFRPVLQRLKWERGKSE